MDEPGYRGLIIDDDPAIVTELADTIHSMGFACETADCTEAVRQHVAGDPFDFIILDLEIPVRDGGIPQLQHGKNLLRELQGQPATAAVPVIVITGNWQQDPYAGTDVLTLGAAGYVVKPFGIYGRSLDDELRRVLGDATPRTKAAALRPFRGATLVFTASSVTLAGVTIAHRRGGSYGRKILDALNTPTGPTAQHRWRGFSGTKLAAQIGAAGGQTAVGSAVKALRKKITKLLGDELALEVGRDDVIENGNQGYRFTDFITVGDGTTTPDDPAFQGRQAGGDPANGANDPGNHGHDPANARPGSMSDPAFQPREGRDPANDGTDDAANRDGEAPEHERRRAWAMMEVKSGRELRRADLVERFGVSTSTARRDLRALIEGGDVEFVGPTKTGFYRLRRADD